MADITVFGLKIPVNFNFQPPAWQAGAARNVLVAAGPPAPAQAAGAVAGGPAYPIASGDSAGPSLEVLEAMIANAISFDAVEACNPPGGRALTAQEKQAVNSALDTIPPLPPSVTHFNIAGNTGRLAQADVDARMRGAAVA